ncbi:MAG: O-antigen ligase family protein [Candidatus Tritonobacter lacicola]|nr:O-antigen ligase family protein [Candidatus Tritonobacter lacicola]
MRRGGILGEASLVVLAAVLLIRPFVSSASSPGFNVIFFAAVLAACVLTALSTILAGGKDGGGTAFSDAIAYLFLGTVIAGLLRSPDRAGAADLFYPMAGALFAYLLASRLGAEERARDVLLTCICTGLVLVSIWGIYQYFYGLEALRERAITEGWQLDELTWKRLRMVRVYAGFVSPNALAGFIALLSPLLFCFLLKAKRLYLVCLLQLTALACIVCAARMQSMPFLALSLAYACVVFVMRRRISLKGLRAVGIIPALLVTVCLLFTGSKSVYIIFAVSCIVLALLVVKKGKLWISLGVLALAIVFLFTMYGTEIGKNVGWAIGARIDYWRGAAGVIREHPIFGCGLGSFWCVYQRYMLPGADMIQHAHNSWLEVWAELGIPGLVLLVVLLGFSIVRGVRNLKDVPGVGAAVGLLAFALHNLVEFDLYVPEIILPAFVLAGLLAPSAGKSASRASSLAFLGVCIAVLVVFGPRLMNDQAAPELEWQLREAMQSGDLEAARAVVPRALHAGRQRAKLRWRLGHFYWKEGDLEGAVAEFRASAEANPRWAEPHFYLSVLHARLGDRELALAEARKAVEFAPARPEIRAGYAGSLRSIGQDERSLREFRRAVELQRAVVEKDERYNRATLEKNRVLLRTYEEYVKEYGKK